MSTRLRVIFLAGLLFAGFAGVSRADDCGVRGYDGGTDILKFECEPVGAIPPSPLQVHTPSGIRGIKLVDPESSPGVPNPAASKFRVRYTDTSVSPNVDTIKAIGFISPGISSCEELQMINHPELLTLCGASCSQTSYPGDGNYILATNINCSMTNPANQLAGYTGLWSDGQGFLPINSFTGKLDGKNKTITGLYINRASVEGVGLFGSVSGATIIDVGLVNANVTIRNTHPGTEYGQLGALAGTSDSSSFTNVYSNAGSITGGVNSYRVGGLLGEAFNSSITTSYTTGSVTAGSKSHRIAGLVGGNEGATVISKSYSTASITAGNDSWNIGGLVGRHLNSASIINSYATGAVTVGGSGAYHAGGLVGKQDDTASTTNSYSTGNVTGTDRVGGLVGYLGGSATISNSYSAGKVVGTTAVGGFVGNANGTISNSFWDSIKAGLPNGCDSACTGVTAFGASKDAFNSTKAPLSSWDFTNAWQVVPCNYPNLKNVGGTQNADNGSSC